MRHVWHKKVKTGAQRKECYAKNANRMREGIWGWLQVIQNFLSEVCFLLQISKIHIYTGSDFFQWSHNGAARGLRKTELCWQTSCWMVYYGVVQVGSEKTLGSWTWFSVGPLAQDGVEMKPERVRQEGAGACDSVFSACALSPFSLAVWNVPLSLNHVERK